MGDPKLAYAIGDAAEVFIPFVVLAERRGGVCRRREGIGK